MAGIRRTMVLWVCFSFLFLQLSSNAAAGFYSQSRGVTVKKPQVITTPEEAIPKVEDGSGKKGVSKWLWALLGVVVVGGVAAVASGGGSSGGGGGDEDTGDIVITGPAP